MAGLTDNELRVFHHMCHGSEKQGDGPWGPSWLGASSIHIPGLSVAQVSAAMRGLARKGRVYRRDGGRSAVRYQVPYSDWKARHPKGGL